MVPFSSSGKGSVGFGFGVDPLTIGAGTGIGFGPGGFGVTGDIGLGSVQTNPDLKSPDENFQQITATNQEDFRVIATVIISEIVTQLRKPPFQKAMKKIREQALNSSTIDEKKEKILSGLSELNNPDIAMLENLTFLKNLADIFHFKAVSRVCAIQITKSINRTVEAFKSKLKEN